MRFGIHFFLLLLMLLPFVGSAQSSGYYKFSPNQSFEFKVVECDLTAISESQCQIVSNFASGGTMTIEVGDTIKMQPSEDADGYILVKVSHDDQEVQFRESESLPESFFDYNIFLHLFDYDDLAFSIGLESEYERNGIMVNQEMILFDEVDEFGFLYTIEETMDSGMASEETVVFEIQQYFDKSSGVMKSYRSTLLFPMIDPEIHDPEISTKFERLTSDEEPALPLPFPPIYVLMLALSAITFLRKRKSFMS